MLIRMWLLIRIIIFSTVIVLESLGIPWKAVNCYGCVREIWLLGISIIVPCILLCYSIYIWITTKPPEFPETGGPRQFFVSALLLSDVMFLLLAFVLVWLTLISCTHLIPPLLACCIGIAAVAILWGDYIFIGQSSKSITRRVVGIFTTGLAVGLSTPFRGGFGSTNSSESESISSLLYAFNATGY